MGRHVVPGLGAIKDETAAPEIPMPDNLGGAAHRRPAGGWGLRGWVKIANRRRTRCPKTWKARQKQLIRPTTDTPYVHIHQPRMSESRLSDNLVFSNASVNPENRVCRTAAVACRTRYARRLRPSKQVQNQAYRKRVPGPRTPGRNPAPLLAGP